MQGKTFYRENATKDTSLGKIPHDWTVVRLNSVARLIMGQSPPSSTYNRDGVGLPFLQGKMEFGDTYPSPVAHCSNPIRVAEQNDVLMSVRAPVGDVNLAPFRLCIGRGLAAMRFDRKVADYLFYLYFLQRIKRSIERLGKGSTFKALVKPDLENLNVVLPPYEEQQRIAKILRSVDQAIEETNGIMATVERLKKGLMQELLTKGIGHKEFKYAEELGCQIPREWKIVSLGDVTSIRYGLGQPPESDEKGVPMIRATNIKRGAIVEMGLLRVKRSAIPKSHNAFLRAGDVIVVRSGAYTGDIGHVTEKWEGAIAGYDLVLSPSKQINSAFLASYLLSQRVQKYFSQLRVRAAQPHLNSGQVSRVLIPLPSLDEQRRIAETLGTVNRKLEVERNQNAALEKAKQGLMDSLLTGKIRVKVR